MEEKVDCKTISGHKLTQDGYFLQCSQSHQIQRSAAVQQDSCLPAQAAHSRSDITSAGLRVCGADSVSSSPPHSSLLLEPRMYEEHFSPYSQRGRIRFRRERLGQL